MADKNDETCRFSRNMSLDAQIVEAETAALKGLYHAARVDVSDKVCPTDPCSSIHNGTVVYRDAHHITVDFALTLVPFLDQKMSPFIFPPPKS